jgi:flagellar hook-associated protein 1 FlgK
MATINSAFDIISSALNADQSALNIVANNVANANTTGYTRETPTWNESAPAQINGVSYGTGVTQTGPGSVRDNVLNQRLAQQQQLASGTGARLSALNTLQALFTPDSGSAGATAGDIGSDLTSFFNSFSSLEANPTDDPLRQQVLSAATTLAGDMSNTAASIVSQQASLDQEATGVVTQVNALTSAIAQLNQQIQAGSSSGGSATLEDQRQQDIAQLSQLIGANQVRTENNGLSLTTTSGALLFSSGTSFAISSGTSGGVTHLFLGATDETAALTQGGGELAGLLTVRDQDIPNALIALDQESYSIATAVNAQNNAGTNLNGVEGTGTNAAGITGTGLSPLYIFAQPAQIAGSALAMNVVMTDPSQIAAASFGNGTGDNSNVVAMASLATQATVNGQTPSNSYSQFISDLGSAVSEAQIESTAQSASVTQLQTQQNALSGVSLNDEAVAMQQFERSYQAASQVFSMLNTMMGSALNLGVETAVS